ncbi:anthranilate synthase component 2 [Thermodesulfovibrio aggregans]|uniref:Anthranilate synthase component 2 n=1 Tax=Thermodesulfovibrio aggregans TaxID=86166 RepID=A0A0U9HUU2_9BACT|nr:aminodeoxychorismate/anthranilate synthase component II [Thermodesulfovibrio aggregans]GAQ95690.1 anthranilate synthase component 2 [Thermodesulfovibrio aggregans]
MILLIDNYDSFTYNLYQYIGEINPDIVVYRNDQITIEEIEKLNPERIIISPGPCTPKEAGVSCNVIMHFAGKVPILGVCLGHQAIGAAFGAKIVRCPEIMHGKTSLIYHDGKTIFRDLPNPFEATRYHSLIIDKESLPDCLTVTAWTSNGIIMGIRHKEYIIEGVQFHPESILTKVGKDLLKNFLKL